MPGGGVGGDGRRSSLVQAAKGRSQLQEGRVGELWSPGKATPFWMQGEGMDSGMLVGGEWGLLLLISPQPWVCAASCGGALREASSR